MEIRFYMSQTLSSSLQNKAIELLGTIRSRIFVVKLASHLFQSEGLTCCEIFFYCILLSFNVLRRSTFVSTVFGFILKPNFVFANFSFGIKSSGSRLFHLKITSCFVEIQLLLRSCEVLPRQQISFFFLSVLIQYNRSMRLPTIRRELSLYYLMLFYLT